MASSMPIPRPPRTPTPPADEPLTSTGLDLLPPPGNVRYDPNALSPVRIEPYSLSVEYIDAAPASPTFLEPMSPRRMQNGRSEDGPDPFNFEPAAMAKTPVVKSVGPAFSWSAMGSAIYRLITDHRQNIGQRRGHKYKHSSVSHQIFLEPPPRAPLALPNSLPIPTFSECRASMTTDQKVRFWWSVCHMMVAAYTAWNANGSAALEALSHLIFYDSLGALLCVIVEVLANFEVWGRSSIRHPFGLKRVEVVAGFALSILLVFMGFDLISHNAKHALESIGHEPHHPHKHNRVSAGAVDLTAVLAIVSTLISAVGLKNHARIGKAMRFAAMENLPSVLSNPSHFLTLSCSAVVLLLPLLSLHAYEWIDNAISITIALAMCFLGLHLGKTVGSMLLMSYSGGGVSDVIRDIESDPLVAKVEEAKFWQAHYGVGIANIRLRVRGSEEQLLRLRERITSLIRNRLSGGYGRGGQKWEVSIQCRMDNDFGRIQSFGHDFVGR